MPLTGIVILAVASHGPPTCPSYESKATPGFMTETDHTVPSQVRWADGEPKTGGPPHSPGRAAENAAGTRVRTYRCDQYGLLESYAMGPA